MITTCLCCARSPIALHARGLCSNCYKNHREEYPRSKIHRAFSARERAFIRANWGKLSCVEIAGALGRQRRDVYAAAVRFGASKPKHILKTTPGLRKRLKRLHARGYSDREIGQKVGHSHATVGRWLRRMGLPSNCRTRPTDPFPARTREKQRRAAMRRIREQGLEDAVPFLRKHLDGRIEAVKMGWPQAETLLAARILEDLRQHGPLKILQLVAHLGGCASWTGQVVRGLKHRGLVEVLRRQGRECLYGLRAGLERSWERDAEPRIFLAALEAAP